MVGKKTITAQRALLFERQKGSSLVRQVGTADDASVCVCVFTSVGEAVSDVCKAAFIHLTSKPHREPAFPFSHLGFDQFQGGSRWWFIKMTTPSKPIMFSPFFFFPTVV